jgi:hypothetical protein
VLISYKNKFIFVHIYKNAGISITNALLPYAVSKNQWALNNWMERKYKITYLFHATIKENSNLQNWISMILHITYKRLHHVIPAHPQPLPTHVFARQIRDCVGADIFNSFFTFGIVRNPWDWQVSLYHYGLESTLHPQRKLFQQLGNFENYIHWRCENDVRLQKDFLYDEHGKLLVNFVGRFENLKEDFKYICSNLNLMADLDWTNRSDRRKAYQSYYTRDTADLVRKTFAPDIELFGYSF